MDKVTQILVYIGIGMVVEVSQKSHNRDGGVKTLLTYKFFYSLLLHSWSTLEVRSSTLATVFSTSRSLERSSCVLHSASKDGNGMLGLPLWTLVKTVHINFIFQVVVHCLAILLGMVLRPVHAVQDTPH